LCHGSLKCGAVEKFIVKNSTKICSFELKYKKELLALVMPVFRDGETYAIPVDISCQEAIDYWTSSPKKCFIVLQGEKICATYYICENQLGNGNHICNCGYITGPKYEGQGFARQMLEHSFLTAKSLGFTGMQFNFVVSSNIRAVETWKKYNFKKIGCVPRAFRHPNKGLIDALIMYKDLV